MRKEGKKEPSLWLGSKGSFHRNAHLLHQSCVKFLGGVVAHLLLSVVHRRDLKHDGKVSSGTYGDGDGGNFDAQKVHRLLVDSEAVIHFSLYPMLKIDHKVDLSGHADTAHAEETANVHNTNAAKLYVVTDDLWCLADERFT